MKRTESSSTTTQNNPVVLGDEAVDIIRQGLSQSANPLKFVEQFQKDNALSSEFAQDCIPVLRLLDLIGVSRDQFYSPLVSKLSEVLIQQLQNTDQTTLSRLAEATFPYIRIPELRPVALAVLESMKPSIPEVFLRQLSAYEDVFLSAPIAIRRQVWRADPLSLSKDLSPLIAQYISESHDSGLWPPIAKSRQIRPLAAKKTADFVKDSYYPLIVDHLKRVYLSTRNNLIAAMRCDILMELHDSGLTELCSQDNCHELIWCLDACARDSSIGDARCREIRNAKAHLTPSSLAFSVISPFTISVALKNAFSSILLNDKNDILTTSCNLICIADQSFDLISNSSHELNADSELILINFLKSITSGSPLRSLASSISSSSVCRKAFLYHVADSLASNVSILKSAEQEISAHTQELIAFACSLSDKEISSEPMFSKSLVSIAISSNNRGLIQMILDNLNPHCASLEIRESLIHLVTNAHSQLVPVDLPSIVEMLISAATSKESEIIDNMLKSIGEKITPQNLPKLQSLLDKIHSNSSQNKQQLPQIATHVQVKTPTPPPPEVCMSDEDQS